MFGPIKAIQPGWTIWDAIETKGSKTIQEFINWLKETYNVNTKLVSSGTLAVYNTYLPGKKHAPRLSRAIEDVHREIGIIVEGRNYLILEVGAATADEGIDVRYQKSSMCLNYLSNIFLFKIYNLLWSFGGLKLLFGLSFMCHYPPVTAKW